MPSTTQPDEFPSVAWALNLFPEDDWRHWELRAFLFGRLQYRALARAEYLRKREDKDAVQVEDKAVPPPGPSDP
jgi:hypothetical protein